MRNIVQIQKKIYPVGHGGFYSEVFKSDLDQEFLFVYDCGSRSTKKLSEAIDSYYKDNDRIDLLVISHFHNDHYNGLPRLIKEKNIKAIMLPFLNIEERIISFLHYALKENEKYSPDFKKMKDVLEITMLPKRYLRKAGYKDKILIVEKFDEREKQQDNLELKKMRKMIVNLKSGQKVKGVECFDWVFFPFNLSLEIKENERKMIEKIIQKFQTKSLLKTLKKIKDLKNSEIKLVLNELKVIYEEFLGKEKLNQYSLCVYSGPEKEDLGNACLYLGDFEATQKNKNLEILKNFFASVIKNIEVIQIPHHGSRNNFDLDLIFKNVKQCFISASTSNKKKHHPNPEVISEIKSKNCEIFIVNQKSKILEYNYIYIYSDCASYFFEIHSKIIAFIK